MASASTPSTRTRRTEWSLVRERYLLQILKELKRANRWCDSGPKRESWSYIVEQLNLRCTETTATREQIKNHLFELKKNYRIVNAIRENSGFGWDSYRQMPTADDNTWREYLQAYPKAKKFRNGTFPLYDDLDELYHGTAAKGKDAVSTINIDADDCYRPELPPECLPIGTMDEGTDSSDGFNADAVEVEPSPATEHTVEPVTDNQDYGKRKSSMPTSSKSSKKSNRSVRSIIAHSFEQLVELRSESNSARSQGKYASKIAYRECLKEMDKMDLDMNERFQLSELLRDEFNKEAFMHFNSDERMIWARRKFI